MFSIFQTVDDELPYSDCPQWARCGRPSPTFASEGSSKPSNVGFADEAAVHHRHPNGGYRNAVVLGSFAVGGEVWL
jgi:hypothetical protein